MQDEANTMYKLAEKLKELRDKKQVVSPGGGGVSEADRGADRQTPSSR